MNRKRILWLDIAKAIAIILTIVGHSAEGALRDVIYSFHMPLFFVVSGYTFKPLNGNYWTALRKDWKRLILPVFLVCGIQFLFNVLNTPGDFLNLLKQLFLSLLWGNGCANYSLPKIGIIWFLLALFYAKQFYRLAMAWIPRYRLLFLLVLAFAGVCIGKVIWLPQSLDLVMVALVYMELGFLYRSMEGTQKQILPGIGCVCFTIWVYLAYQEGISMELAVRTYSNSIVCLLTAAAGSIWVIQFCQAIESVPLIVKPLAFIGQHSLELLCIHSLDDCMAPLWKETSPVVQWMPWLPAPLVSLGVRLCCDLLVLVLLVYIRGIPGKLHFRKNTQSAEK